uniref:2-C-methyl-D-erythritol 4-phosphate cytidylyltransferase, chloroplastic n=1 Tax=Noctiluca scintillans TaxID=2966 RepID=A0A7S1AYR1_NOCSC
MPSEGCPRSVLRQPFGHATYPRDLPRIESQSDAPVVRFILLGLAAAFVGKRSLRTTRRCQPDGRSASQGDVGVILLSAGVGKRMGANIPKQYVKLLGKEIALRSLDVFLKCGDVGEIVIVCSNEWRSVFSDYVGSGVRPTIKYAEGGAERQDSVKNGLRQIRSEYVAVHDSARPLVTVAEVEKVVADAHEYGAALLAVPTKATIKQSQVENGKHFVAHTPDRNTMWEAHTPQVFRTELLRRGFKHAQEHDFLVTDDASLTEHLCHSVKLTEGEYTNIKATTPEDINVAEAVLRSRAC